MKYSEKELGKYRRKKQLYAIINEIENNGIEIDYHKYPEYKTLAVLSKIVLDYQDLVPGDEPDLEKMTDVVDEFEIGLDEMDWKVGGTPVKENEIKEPTIPDKIPEPVINKVREPDWELIKTIDLSDIKSNEGRAKIVRAVYLELLFREPDSGGLETYKNSLRDGMSISNIRDAIKRSTEYKAKHNIA